jgi:hypothetical protein
MTVPSQKSAFQAVATRWTFGASLLCQRFDAELAVLTPQTSFIGTVWRIVCHASIQ